MSTVYWRDGAAYYSAVVYTADGQKIRVRRSLKTRDPELAEIRRLEIDAVTQPPLEHVTPATILIKQVISEYLRVHADITRRSHKWYADTLNRFAKYFGTDRCLFEVSPDDLMAYRQHRRKTVAAATVAGDLRALRAMFNWCIHQKWLAESPCTKAILRIPGIRARAPVALTEDQLALYQEKLKGTIVYPVLMFGAYAGLRLGEMLYLERSDILPYIHPPYAHKLVLVNKEHVGFTLKSHKAREIPVEPELEAALPTFKENLMVPSPRGLLWTRNNLFRAWQRELKDAKLPPVKEANGRKSYGICIHDLRRTYATLMHEYRGVPLDRLRRRLGHADLKTTQGYLCGTEL